MNKIKKIFKDKIIESLCFVGVVFIVLVLAHFFSNYLLVTGSVICLVALIFISIFIWVLSGHAVMKSLFVVGATLSLIIFIAQSYCELPISARTGDDALRILLIFGLVFVGCQFSVSLLKELDNRFKEFKNANKIKKSWTFLILLAIGTGIFIEQVLAVVGPIVQNICIYHT